MGDETGHLQGSLSIDTLSIPETIRASINIVNDSDSDMSLEQYAQKRKMEEIEEDSRDWSLSSEVIAETPPPVAKVRHVIPGSPNNESPTGEAASSSALSMTDRPPVSVYFNKCKDNVYSLKDNGPYILYVDNLIDSHIHAMRVGKIIRDFAFNIFSTISSIEKIGRKRVKLVLKNREASNALIRQEFWVNSNLICYIPNFVLYRQGIIRNVDVSLSEEEIVKYADSELEIVRARRITRSRAGEERQPLPLVILSFKGQTLPANIKIFGVCCRVEQYIQRPIQCFKCLKYGHTSRFCRNSNNALCENCGGNHIGECKAPPFCIYCKVNHRSTDQNNCKEFQRQMNIKLLMSSENISFSEAQYNLNKLENEKKGKTYSQITSRPPPINQFPPLPQYELNPQSQPEYLGEAARGTNNSESYPRKASNPSVIPSVQNISNSLNIPHNPILSQPAYVQFITDKCKNIIVSIINQILSLPQPSSIINEISSVSFHENLQNIIKNSFLTSTHFNT